MEFKIAYGYDRDEGDRFYVNGKEVGHSDYDMMGSAGMEAMEDIFERIADVLNVKVVKTDYTDEE